MERKFTSRFKKTSALPKTKSSQNLLHYESNLNSIEDTIEKEEQLFRNWDALQK